MSAPKQESELTKRIADALYDALLRNEDALVMGSVESRDVLIDGNFDLMIAAERIQLFLDSKEPRKKVSGDVV